MRDERETLHLFDLIARSWTAVSAVEQVVFNASQTAVAFGCADGQVAIAATADKSAPSARIRRAVDTAQLSIQPRTGTYPGLRYADHFDGRSSAVARHGADNFLFGKSTGRMNAVTPGGISVYLPPKANAAIAATDAAEGLAVAYAVGADVHLWSPDRGEMALTAPATVTALQFSPNRRQLAVAHNSGIQIWDATDWSAGAGMVFLPGTTQKIGWSGDGQWIVACLGADGVGVINTGSLDCTHRDRFPGPVNSAGFGVRGDSMVAAGAYRVAAWMLTGAPVTTGKAGLVLIDAVATCPTRNLVAVGYANGLLSLAEIGQSAEILLRQDTGSGITAMCWSDDGRYLGFGGRDGTAALIEFPDDMFKS